MKNKTFFSCIVLIFLSIIGVSLLYSTNVRAQEITPETKCYNKKLKAAGSYVRCLLRAERDANRNMEETSEESVALCHERFEKRFKRAEAQAADNGASCPSHGGLVPYQQTIIGATATINSSNDVKTLNIEIAQDDLVDLMEASFSLNIAVKVNDTTNVVWRSASNYASFNEYQWSPVFHVFGASPPELGSSVDIKTNVVDITLGQDVVLDTNDILNAAVAGNTPTAMTFLNDSDNPINAALAQLLTFNGTKAITPIYVSSEPIQNKQSDLITPTQKVLVWFGEEMKTGEIFKEPKFMFIKVDLTNDSTATRLFSNNQWSTPEEN